MNPRWTCYRCGKQGAAGEPRTCETCFAYFFRHDPGSPYYCGGCTGCVPAPAEQRRLDSQRGQMVLYLGAVPA